MKIYYVPALVVFLSSLTSMNIAYSDTGNTFQLVGTANQCSQPLEFAIDTAEQQVEAEAGKHCSPLNSVLVTPFKLSHEQSQDQCNIQVEATFACAPTEPGVCHKNCYPM